MKRGLISIGILAGFLFSLLLVSGVFAKDVVEFSPAYGKVKFTHKKHAETLKITHEAVTTPGRGDHRVCGDATRPKPKERLFLRRTPTIKTAKAAMMRQRKPASQRAQPGVPSAM
jgi:hypothetical protein